jgi:ADP-ribose pyrophosphatase YjhB (NUDIX family)
VKKEFERFQISQAAFLVRNEKCLILEPTAWPGLWDLPGGRIYEREEWEDSFRREIKEELDLSNFEILRLVDFDVWYTEKGNPVSVVVYLIKNDTDEITLSAEHTQMLWVEESELDNYNFLWPNAKRMLKKGFAYKKS